ncbi:unnamed protein product [Brachionus calyciflorus]|uniref:Macro domain-containing protein n=1 Tax=Brachionus calyciflorus TaxID=104777 RepID=A0A813YQU4_9BILA|nr:unnamed protein product [Brachionus calyciflorus]
MASALVQENIKYEKSKGFMKSHVVKYKSQNPWNNSFYSIKSKNGLNELKLCLINSDLTNIDANCILNIHEYGAQNPKLDILFQKAGQIFKNEFDAKLKNNLVNLMNGFDVSFITLSGDLINCEYILNFVYIKKTYSQRNEIFQKAYDIYTKIVNMANISNIRTLAISLPFLNNEIDSCLKALIESTYRFSEIINNQSLKFIYVVSDRQEILKKFENFISNGFKTEYLASNFDDKKNFQKRSKNKATTMTSVLMNENDQNDKNSMLASSSKIKPQINLFENSIETPKIENDTKCDICKKCTLLLNPVTSVYNKYCGKDSTCAKCSSLPDGSSLNCYFCDVYIFLDKLAEYENLILNHDLIICSYDFCDLINEEKEIVKLTCGHRACNLVKSSSRLCTICGIHKLLDTLCLVKKINVNKIKWTRIKELKYVSKNDVTPVSDQDIFIINSSVQTKEYHEWNGVFDKSVQDNFYIMNFFVPDGQIESSDKKVNYHGFVKKVFLPKTVEGDLISKLIEDKFTQGSLLNLKTCESKVDDLVVDFICADLFKISKQDLIEALKDENYLDNLKTIVS